VESLRWFSTFTQLIPLLEDLHARPVAGKLGRPRQKPDQVLADRGYDHEKYRRLLWARGIKPCSTPRRAMSAPPRTAHRLPSARVRARSRLTLASILCWRRLKTL